MGVPEDEVVFVHSAKTDIQKERLFEKVRQGTVRVLIGSTAKMGCGTNVQNRLVALHHLDVPWRPSDLEQREGRILRQGNTNEDVSIKRYVQEETFDSYSWQIIENKQKFIGQIMTGQDIPRSSDNIDEQALTYAEIKALACGSPLIKEKIDGDIRLTRLRQLKKSFDQQQYDLDYQIRKRIPNDIAENKEKLVGALADRTLHESFDGKAFEVTIDNKTYTDPAKAHMALLMVVEDLKAKPFRTVVELGEYKGFNLSIYRVNNAIIRMVINGKLKYELEINRKVPNNFDSIDKKLSVLSAAIEKLTEKNEALEKNLKTAEIEREKPFEQQEEMEALIIRIKELDVLLSQDAAVVSCKDESEENEEEVA
jgi:hypothetical protein